MSKLFTKEQGHVIKVMNFGNLLEWFDVYSFSFLAVILGQAFFPTHSPNERLFLSFVVFGLGFITRPLGGIIFGRIGDLFGRKKAFVLSIILLSSSTCLMGLLPTYQSWGIYSPLSLGLLRICQSIPTGGEIPGTVCYLFENGTDKNRRFMTSWTAFGNQIGAMVAVLETFLLENLLSSEQMLTWGWRIAFITGGFIGLCATYLRYTLHETPVFQNLKKTHQIDHETISKLLIRYKKRILIGVGFGAIDASAFYLIATYIPNIIGNEIGITTNNTLIASISILIIITVLLPLFGYLGDKISNKTLCIISALSIILLLYPLANALSQKDLYRLAILGIITLIPISCITALVPYLVANLFPAQVRFTGTGISMNVADGLIGGFTPAIGILLTQATGSQAAFCWYILGCSLISFGSYLFAIKD